MMKTDVTLDAVGIFCPMPIIKTAKALKEMASGQVLEVVADDAGIKQDMPEWCRSTGNEFLGLEERDDEYHVFVRKK